MGRQGPAAHRRGLRAPLHGVLGSSIVYYITIHSIILCYIILHNIMLYYNILSNYIMLYYIT